MGAVDFGIDVSVDEEEVGAAVVVDVGEHGSQPRASVLMPNPAGKVTSEKVPSASAWWKCRRRSGLVEVKAAVSVVVGGSWQREALEDTPRAIPGRQSYRKLLFRDGWPELDRCHSKNQSQKSFPEVLPSSFVPPGSGGALKIDLLMP